MKWLVLIAAALVGFLVAFSFTARDEIGAEVERKLDEDFIPQCERNLRLPPQVADSKTEICGCMKREFDNRGIKLTDAFGDQRGEMQEIVNACAMNYR
ncbi:hypothetical protein [Qipengyuania sphaerica]|uniref:hypothetical protein n=1 Tax=Qipengyuania sphaerica TaxID=2867243 RepID=UPI001C880777|nr:hypothetical protein [Qipengyuania sphaerica]MBX7540860.1 hypothetical protein [Qipengyuania sphaerica]